MKPVTVHLESDHPSRGVPASLKRDASRVIGRIVRAEKQVPCAISVVFGSDADLRDLNTRYRDKGYATDVLSFGLYYDTASGLRTGDIFISLDRAASQARDIGHSLTDELWRLIIHGIFHLCGYDHESPRDNAIMENKVNRWLARRAVTSKGGS